MLCRYENFVGLTEVKAAQARVVECEKKFIAIQEMRREAQKMISDVRKRIKVRFSELIALETTTRRYGPLRRPTSSSCRKFRPMDWFSLKAKKELAICIYLIGGF